MFKQDGIMMKRFYPEDLVKKIALGKMMNPPAGIARGAINGINNIDDDDDDDAVLHAEKKIVPEKTFQPGATTMTNVIDVDNVR